MLSLVIPILKHHALMYECNMKYTVCTVVSWLHPVMQCLRYLHQFHFMERCLSGSGWSSQFVRQFQLWYAKPGLSCRPTCRIGCRISNTRVIKLPDFVHWGSYYWRQPGRQAGGQQSLRQLFSYQDWSYARWPCYGFSATGLNSGYSALHMALTPIGNRPWTQVLHIIKVS